MDIKPPVLTKIANPQVNFKMIVSVTVAVFFVLLLLYVSYVVFFKKENLFFEKFLSPEQQGVGSMIPATQKFIDLSELDVIKNNFLENQQMQKLKLYGQTVVEERGLGNNNPFDIQEGASGAVTDLKTESIEKPIPRLGQ